LGSYFLHVFLQKLNKPTSIAPLAYFRIAFGFLLFVSTVRFISLGWISNQYLEPTFHFTYFGFDWVKPYSATFLYTLFGGLLISSITVALGLFYRLSSIILFICFTYIELLDKSYYLNHYYFVSVMAFIMIFLPANKNYSLDSFFSFTEVSSKIPGWIILLLQLQIAIVYVAAGIAKINPDWLFEALPLRIWLPAKDAIPLIGPLFNLSWIPFVFSWFGMVFDCTIPFLLWWRKSRILAYFAVVVFHLLTGILFQIGVFPLVMILLTPIFFDEKFHQKLLKKLSLKKADSVYYQPSRFIQSFFIVYLVLQIVLPFRPLLYKGNMFWTEEGYRFGWRVMLAEKVGTATFFIRENDATEADEKIINNSDYLNLHQEKQMAFQPDMILQFAHYLKTVMTQEYGYKNPVIRCESYVSLNAAPSKLLIDPTVDLTEQQRGYNQKTWILPYKK
jgi:hypothetical protein